jgi:Protein of unknown function (DUF3048) N-terminal domain/Protein of unknown function (DUF3048) C-terminal domain
MIARPVRQLGLVLLCGTLLAACAQLTAAESSPSPRVASRTPTPVATPAPAPTPKIPYSPLTGLQVPALSQVLVVKVDNTRSARPQAGVASADVVYVEEVEDGVTRLAAVFSSTLPPSVGPIRSARTTDIELLTSYGSVTLAYSGANDGVQEELNRSGLRLLNDDLGAPGFHREEGRPRVFDLMGDPAAFLAASRSLPARDVGFRFGPPAPGGRPVAGVTASYPNASIGATWDAAAGRWTMSLDGRPSPAAEGGHLSAATVVVQYVDVEDSGYVDIVGSRTPLVRTVGAGPAVILRDGMAYDGGWNRPSAYSRTSFVGADGAAIPFAPGPVWVLLVNKASPIAISG